MSAAFRKILVPFDFSEAAGQAARYAVELAALSGAEATVLHVLPPIRYDFSMAEPSPERARDVNRRRAAAARDELAFALRNLPRSDALRSAVIEGDPAEEIIAAANTGGYDLLALSTRGASSFRRALTIGSVTTKALHEVELPVITSVRFENRRSPVEIRRILCAIDLGPQSARVLCWGKQTACAFGAGMSIVHAAAGLEDPAWQDAARRSLAARVNDLAQSLHVEADAVITFDNPARAISELARDTAADLVVIGRGVSQDLIGRLRATAYDIIRQCPCPVASI